MPNFATLLSPAARKKLDAVRAERTRAYGLSNTQLGALLLRLSAEFIEERNLKRSVTYDSSFAFSILPELARRLGVAIDPSQDNAELIGMTAREFRFRAGNTLVNTGRGNSFVSDLLLCEPCHGNIVVFALDRICPGIASDRDDPICRSLAEVSRNRGVPFDGIWTPAIEDYPRASQRGHELALTA